MSAVDFAARHWYRLSALSLALVPLSLLFRLLAAMRRAGYRAGVFKSARLAVPVVVFGNLVAGGTGKTPLVIWSAELLRAHGRRPGIVLRGHGGSATAAPREVGPGDDAGLVGDEALLLAGRAGCPVWACADRAAAARALLRRHPDCDVILADDGLQHYALQRDLEIAVEDARGHGNGFMLPAGPLREPASRGVDATVVNAPPEQPPAGRAPGAVFHMQLVPQGWATPDGRAVERAELAGRRLHAVAGIGNPGRFFDTLRAMGLDPVTHVFADHHAYTASDLDFRDCDLVLMTEKDAVKCRSFGRSDLMALRVAAEPDAAFADFLLKALHGFSPA